jgi:ATP-dependent RNA helicase DDX51/DBP6
LTKQFSALNISTKVLDNLSKRGFQKAFAVQAALIPLLLPGPAKYQGDICVSAATGSGKTLGYLLPLIDLLKQKLVTRLRALIVVPTRELVSQARQVAEMCAAGTGVKVGTALGSASLASEQAQLINQSQRYDKPAAQRMYEKAEYRMQTGFQEDDSLFDDICDLLPDHVPEYSSAVDILICTPGRLVDHLRSSPGFSLAHVEYLVIDEADRLLDDGFQDWVDVVLGGLPFPTRKDLSADPLHRVLKPRFDGVQKVILSATMTRDLSRLAVLKLRRPTLLAIAGTDAHATTESNGLPHLADTAELPAMLHESAIPVGDGSEKPLFLVELLNRLLHPEQSANLGTSKAMLQKHVRSDSTADQSDSEDSSDVETTSTESDTSTDSSDSSTSESDESETTSDDDSSPELETTSSSVAHEPQASLRQKPSSRILVFVNTNEDALRLSHLLGALDPSLGKCLGTLTKISTSSGRRTLSAFKSGKLSILIASDRASRGLDVPDLSDVISYDMPRDITSYVHRVGRTARAGQSGSAWTFYTHPEARWFFNTIARSSSIRRAQPRVERMRINLDDDSDKKQRYEQALNTLQSAVFRGD